MAWYALQSQAGRARLVSSRVCLHSQRLNMSFVRLGQHSYVLRVQGRRSRHATPPMRGAPLSLLFSVTTPEEVGMGSRLGRKGAELPAALDGTGPHVGRFRAVLDVGAPQLLARPPCRVAQPAPRPAQ